MEKKRRVATATRLFFSPLPGKFNCHSERSEESSGYEKLLTTAFGKFEGR